MPVKRAVKKRVTKAKPAIKSTPAGKFPTIPSLTILLILTTVGMIFFFLNSIQYKIENKQLQEMVLLLTPTQSPLLKDYNENSFKRPKDIPESTISAKIKVPIIMYHYVEHVKDRSDTTRLGLSVTPEALEQQLKAIKAAGYDTYFARDIPDIMNKTISSDKFVILTFDDGYEDFYLNVYPLLKRYNMRATNYVIADYIGRKDFMNPKQIQELIDSDLVEIGSHTLDHMPLKTSTEAHARKEIFDSKVKLETQFHINIKTFAYPSGSFNLDTVKFVKEAGYVAAVSTISGVDQTEENLYYLSRLRPGMFTPVK
jgi:peptidoglycan/xylan/chitin deacetylase (PgdA/CDA1 family)